MSNSLQPHGLENAMLSCPSPSSRICSNSRPWDAIQPSHPLSSPSPPAFNLSQHQDLFQWVSSSHQVANVLEFWYIEHIYCANIFKKNAKYFQEFNSKHKFRCVQYKEIYELFFIKFQLLCFAGEEMEAQLGLSLSLKAIEPGWNERKNQRQRSSLTSNPDVPKPLWFFFAAF